MPDHPSRHIRQRHWVLRGCGFIEQRKREREKKRSEKRDRARARKPDSKGFVFAGKTSLSSAILTGGCQATTNSAGIVLSDRSIAERLFGFSTPGLLMKRDSAKIRRSEEHT